MARHVRNAHGILAVVALCAALTGCSGRSVGGGSVAGDGVFVAPSPAILSTQLTAVVQSPGTDPAGCTYRWYRNDAPIPGAEAPTLDPGQFVKGDEIAVEVTFPGIDGAPGRTVRARTRIEDAPPVVRDVRIAADPAAGGADLDAIAEGHDPDGDDATLSYRWLRNGAPIEGATGPRLQAAQFARGDHVVVEVTAHSGKQSSTPLRSPAFGLENRAPVFTARPTPLAAGDGTRRYQATAVDPDGDVVRYELVRAPAGMVISPEGVLDWTRPGNAPAQGEYPVTIRATDAKGGQATQEFTIRLSIATAASKS